MADLLNKQVKHKTLGIGVVSAQDDKYITVDFPTKSSKFMYPAAFEKFLVPVDADVLKAINDEIAAAKAAEEQAKLEALKAQASSSKSSSISKAYKPVARVAGASLPYLVFQGGTYSEEFSGQFIWAPKYTKGGGTCHHWERLMEIREGDLIFHCADGYIQAISRAKGACTDSARPDKTTGDWTMWEKDGRRVDCEYHQLKKPIKHGAYKDTIVQYCNVKYAPFDKDGNGNMGYLFDLNKDLAVFFMNEIIKKNPEVIDLDYVKFLLV